MHAQLWQTITRAGNVWQVVMAFLVGMGDEEPLRYRILPVNRFMNIGQAEVAVPACMHCLLQTLQVMVLVQTWHHTKLAAS